MRSSKRRKVEADSESVVAEQLITPTIASNLHTGINAVTKVLETEAGASKSHSDRKRKRKRGDSSVLIPTQPEESIGNGGAMVASPELRQPISLVFVCRPDINPHALVAHLPLLVSAVNSRASVDSSGVVLVPLDVGAEARLGAALGLPRVAVVAITVRAVFTAQPLTSCRPMRPNARRSNSSFDVISHRYELHGSQIVRSTKCPEFRRRT